MTTKQLTAEIKVLAGVSRMPAKMTLESLCTNVLQGVQFRRYEGMYPTALYDAAYGILHGLQTGRVDGMRAKTISALMGASAMGFLASLAEKRLSGDDVSRYLNGRRFQWDGECWIAQ